MQNAPESAGTTIELSSLHPNDRNPRKISSDALNRLRASIDRDPQFMALRPILIDESRMILGGNQRYRACLQLGMKSVPSAWVRTATGLTEAQRLRFVLVDNAPEGMAGEWDMEMLASDWQSQDLGDLGFDMDDMVACLPTNEDVDAEPQLDRAEELRQEWGVESGQLWLLGSHRLLCGDATAPETWPALLGDERLQMVWTDPPYGVKLNIRSPSSPPSVHRRRKLLTIENDSLSPAQLREFLQCALGLVAARCTLGAAWYVSAPAGNNFGEFAHVLGREGLDIWRHSLVWLKNKFVFGRADYHYRHEPILYGWIPGGPHFFVDDRTLDSVFEISRPNKSPEHPTMKPVDLVTRCLRNSSKEGWLIGDPFSGSGTTILACEQLGRKCRAIEINPGYVAVALQRFKDATGKRPTQLKLG
jgi:site-specific DNA-methyltransferase (adenine-specific)